MSRRLSLKKKQTNPVKTTGRAQAQGVQRKSGSQQKANGTSRIQPQLIRTNQQAVVTQRISFSQNLTPKIFPKREENKAPPQKNGDEIAVAWLRKGSTSFVNNLILENGGLKYVEASFPLTFQELKKIWSKKFGVDTFTAIYNNDTQIFQLVKSADQIRIRLYKLGEKQKKAGKMLSSLDLKVASGEYDLTYEKSAALYKESGKDFISYYQSVLLEDPDGKIGEIEDKALEGQAIYDKQVLIGKSQEGSVIGKEDAVIGFDQDLEIKKLFGPPEGLESKGKATFLAKASGKSAAVIKLKERYYVYELTKKFAFKDVENAILGNTSLIPKSNKNAPTIVTSDGRVLSAGSRTYELKKASPVRDIAEGKKMVKEKGGDLNDKQAFNLFKIMLRDLALRNLAKVRKAMLKERRKFLPHSFAPSARAGKGLQNDAKALRARLIETSNLVNATDTKSPPDQIKQAQDSITSIGKIYSRNPLVAAFVINDQEEGEPAKKGDVKNELSGKTGKQAAISAIKEINRRLDDVDTIKKHLFSNLDSAVGLVPLHKEVLLQFPPRQKRGITAEVIKHDVKSIAKALGMMAAEAFVVTAVGTVGTPLLGASLGTILSAKGAAESYQALALSEKMREVELATKNQLAFKKGLFYYAVGSALLGFRTDVKAGHLAALQSLMRDSML